MLDLSGIVLDDTQLDLIREVAFPSVDVGSALESDGICTSIIRDIIISCIGEQDVAEDVLNDICRHIFLSHMRGIWPPSADVDSSLAFSNPMGEEGDNKEGTGAVGDVHDLTLTTDKEREEVDDPFVAQLRREAEEEEMRWVMQAKQEEEDRLLAEQMADMHELSLRRKVEIQEQADESFARRLEDEDEAAAAAAAAAAAEPFFGNPYDDDAGLKLQFEDCKQECHKFLCANGADVYYSQPFAVCVVDCIFAQHPEALKASRDSNYLLDPRFMSHVCSSLAWKTLSSRVEPCAYALDKKPCYINRCDKEHYLLQYPCKHWMQPTGCHKLRILDSMGQSLCPFGHDAMVFGSEEELSVAFAEATGTYIPENQVEDAYQYFLDNAESGGAFDYLATPPKAGQSQFHDEEDFPAGLGHAQKPSGGGYATARPAGASKNSKSMPGGESRHVTNLMHAFKFAPAVTKGGQGGAGEGDQELRVRDFSGGTTSTATYPQKVNGRSSSSSNSNSNSNNGNSKAGGRAKTGKIVFDPTWAEGVDRADYERVRGPSVQIVQERNGLYTAARQAFMNNHRDQAARLANDAKEADRRYRLAVQKTALELFYLANKDKAKLNGGLVDLHGLHVAEAKVILQSLLCSSEGQMRAWLAHEVVDRVKIVTGAGRHSAGGVQKLLPAVRQLMDSGAFGATKLKYEEFHDHEGFPAGVIVDCRPLARSMTRN